MTPEDILRIQFAKAVEQYIQDSRAECPTRSEAFWEGFEAAAHEITQHFGTLVTTGRIRVVKT